MSEHDDLGALALIAEIELDLSYRSGLGDEWDNIDPDVKSRIRSSWAAIAPRHCEICICGHDRHRHVGCSDHEECRDDLQAGPVFCECSAFVGSGSYNAVLERIKE